MLLITIITHCRKYRVRYSYSYIYLNQANYFVSYKNNPFEKHKSNYDTILIDKKY